MLSKLKIEDATPYHNKCSCFRGIFEVGLMPVAQLDQLWLSYKSRSGEVRVLLASFLGTTMACLKLTYFYSTVTKHEGMCLVRNVTLRSIIIVRMSLTRLLRASNRMIVKLPRNVETN